MRGLQSRTTETAIVEKAAEEADDHGHGHGHHHH
jgi:chaperonin GroEL